MNKFKIIQIIFDDIIKIIEAGGVGLTCWQILYYFHSKKISNSEQSIGEFELQLQSTIKIMCKQSHNKKLLNHNTAIFLKHHPQLNITNYRFSALPKKLQLKVKWNLKIHLLLSNLAYFDIWSMHVLNDSNKYKTIYSNTYKDIILFIKQFHLELNYIIMISGKYSAVKKLFDMYERSFYHGKR